jgi:hypothetical protein
MEWLEWEWEVRCWWWLGQLSGNANGEVSFWAKNPKLSRQGLISGMPLEMVLEGDGVA